MSYAYFLLYLHRKPHREMLLPPPLSYINPEKSKATTKSPRARTSISVDLWQGFIQIASEAALYNTPKYNNPIFMELCVSDKEGIWNAPVSMPLCYSRGL